MTFCIYELAKFLDLKKLETKDLLTKMQHVFMNIQRMFSYILLIKIIKIEKKINTFKYYKKMSLIFLNYNIIYYILDELL